MKKLLTLLLSVTTVVGAMGVSACSEEPSAQSGNENENVLLLNGFEDFLRDVQGIRLFNGFGAVDHNKNADYVKSGDGSLLLRPVGADYTTSPPYVVVPTYSVMFDYGYGDFTDIAKVTAQVYNAEETEVSLGVGLAGMTRTHQFVEQALRTNADYYVLKPGWNLIEYYVEPAYVNCQDLSDGSFDITTIFGIFFEFERQTGELSLDNAANIYLDDVRLHYAEEKRETTSDFGLASDSEKGIWELADFENTLQNNFFYVPYTVPSTVLGLPTIRVVPAAKHNVTAKSGVNVLELTKRAGVTDGSRDYMMLSEKVMQQAFANIGDDIKANPQKYVIRFDIYNPTPNKDSLTIEYQSDSAYDSETNWTKSYISSSTALAPYSWTSYEVSVSKIDETIKSKATANNATAILFSEHPGKIKFSFSQYYTAENTDDKVLLLDNFRIEKQY